MEEKTQKIIVKDVDTGEILGELSGDLDGLWGIEAYKYNVVHRSKSWLELVLKRLNTCDENYNIDCTNCTNCRGCISCMDCTDCTNCLDCYYCTNCTNCNYCTGCTDCQECYNSAECKDCRRCTRAENCLHCRAEYYIKDIDATSAEYLETTKTNQQKAYDVTQTSVFG